MDWDLVAFLNGSHSLIDESRALELIMLDNN